MLIINGTIGQKYSYVPSKATSVFIEIPIDIQAPRSMGCIVRAANTGCHGAMDARTIPAVRKIATTATAR